jgi:hypothetical protein
MGANWQTTKWPDSPENLTAAVGNERPRRLGRRPHARSESALAALAPMSGNPRATTAEVRCLVSQGEPDCANELFIGKRLSQHFANLPWERRRR